MRSSPRSLNLPRAVAGSWVALLILAAVSGFGAQSSGPTFAEQMAAENARRQAQIDADRARSDRQNAETAALWKAQREADAAAQARMKQQWKDAEKQTQQALQQTVQQLQEQAAAARRAANLNTGDTCSHCGGIRGRSPGCPCSPGFFTVAPYAPATTWESPTTQEPTAVFRSEAPSRIAPRPSVSDSGLTDSEVGSTRRSSFAPRPVSPYSGLISNLLTKPNSAAPRPAQPSDAYSSTATMDLSGNPTVEQLFKAPASAYDLAPEEQSTPSYTTPPTDERDYAMDLERQLYDRAVAQWDRDWRAGKATYKDHPDRIGMDAVMADKKRDGNWGGLTREGDAAFAYWDRIRAADEKTARSMQTESGLAAGKVRKNMTSEQERYVRVFAVSRAIERGTVTGMSIAATMETNPGFKEDVERLRFTAGELGRKYGVTPGTAQDRAFDEVMETTRKGWWEKTAHKFAQEMPAHAAAYDPNARPKSPGTPETKADLEQTLKNTKELVETLKPKP